MNPSNDPPQMPFKRARIDQDPDYDEAAPPDEKRLKYLEDQAKLELAEKVKKILNKQFDIEVKRQQSEITEIENTIAQVRQNLMLLRSVAAQTFYSKNTPSINQQVTIHPAVKSLIGKRPRECVETEKEAATPNLPTDNQPTPGTSTSEALKVPRYIPPIIPETVIGEPIRGGRHCVKKKLIIGNVSKWIPVDERTDSASHKWMVYVRGPQAEPDISSFVRQVTFFLHSTYAPNNVIDVCQSPFHLTRRGWGEFPLKVQVHFHNPLCKPVNIYHDLKLDRSYTGLQQLGAETVSYVMVHTDEFSSTSLAITNEEELQTDSPTKNDSNESAVQLYNGTPTKNYSEESALQLHNGTPIKTEPEESISEVESSEDSHFPVTNSVACEEINYLLPVKVEIEEAKEANLPVGVSKIKPDPDAAENNRMNAMIKKVVVRPPVPSIVKLEPGFAKLATFNNSAAVRVAVPSTTASPKAPITYIRCMKPDGTYFSAKLVPSTLLNYGKPGQSLLRTPQPAAAITLPSNSLIIKKETSLASSIRIRPMISLVAAAAPPAPAAPVQVKIEKKTPTESKYLEEKRKLDDLMSTIRCLKWASARDCLRSVVRLFGLVDPRSSDSVYRSLRPFTAPSIDDYLTWNIGKQRSAEWCRARLIHQLMGQCTFGNGETPWTTKKIMVWCRQHGHSPVTAWTGKAAEVVEVKAIPMTLSEISLPTSETTGQEDAIVDVESLADESDAKIPPQNGAVNQAGKMCIAIDDPDSQLTSHLVESIEQFGFKLGPEPFENCLASFSRILLTRLWTTVADDLLRRSLNESWQRAKGGQPETVSLADVFHAIQNRAEFDFLTNRGMGVNRHQQM